MVLGDEVTTIQKHYSELIPNDAQRIAFEQAHALSWVISSEGTAQPEWLKRKRGSNPARAYRGSGMNGGFKSKSGVDVVESTNQPYNIDEVEAEGSPPSAAERWVSIIVFNWLSRRSASSMSGASSSSTAGNTSLR